MARSNPARANRTWPQRLLLGFNVVLVVACVAAAAGLAKVQATIASVPVVDIGSTLSTSTESDEPRNVLIIGTDSAARLPDGDPVAKGRSGMGQLADVIMILRIDPSDGSAKILSIPRDSRVALAPAGRMDRINAAVAGVDGPKNLVRTIKRNFGIPIDNYVEVDFQAFRDLVDVLGGVPVYFTTPVRDKETGLNVGQPGCILLDSQQALAYARSRHLFYKDDGTWRPDGTGDLGRITRQQDFIKRALRRASDKGIRNPGTAVGIINAAAGAVTKDDTLDVGTILSISDQFRDFNPDSLVTYQVPTVANPRGGVAYQDVVWDEAEPMLEQFRGVEAGVPLVASDVLVDVSGRSDQVDELAPIAAAFDAAGFDGGIQEMSSKPRSTTLFYGPRGRDAAMLVAAQMETLPDIEFDEDLVGYRVVVTIGSDFGGVRDSALPLDELPSDLFPVPESTTTSEVPETTAPPEEGQPGESDGEVVDDTTPDEAPGIVPTDPQAAATCR